MNSDNMKLLSLSASALYFICNRTLRRLGEHVPARGRLKFCLDGDVPFVVCVPLVHMSVTVESTTSCVACIVR
jgi:hypothetical protein